MSKTNPPNFGKPPTPPPPLWPPQPPSKRPAPRRENIVSGARKCCCTTIAFSIQPHPCGGAYDTLVIAVNEHNDAEASRLTIKGGAEAKEIPSHLRWIADKIEKEIGHHDALLINEYVLITGGR
jgi:hypothetical protein